jgi:iron-sulfur cluster insertion protein
MTIFATQTANRIPPAMSITTAETAPSTSTAAAVTRGFGVSERAAKRITRLIARENKPGTYLRISVTGGGCSGFQYIYDLVNDALSDDDHQFGSDSAPVVIDDVSLDLLAGATLDFVDDLMGQYFKMENPNAASSCGCGTSFAV